MPQESRRTCLETQGRTQKESDTPIVPLGIKRKNGKKGKTKPVKRRPCRGNQEKNQRIGGHEPRISGKEGEVVFSVLNRSKGQTVYPSRPLKIAETRSLENKMRKHSGSRSVHPQNRKRGTIVISFANPPRRQAKESKRLSTPPGQKKVSNRQQNNNGQSGKKKIPISSSGGQPQRKITFALHAHKVILRKGRREKVRVGGAPGGVTLHRLKT